MQKIILVNPSSKNVPLIMVPPLVLGTLASYIQKNNPSIEVKIVDEIIGERFSEKLLLDFCPDLVGVTCMTEFSYRAYEIAKLAKKFGILTVIGGKHPTIFPEEAAKYFDYVIAGDGEVALDNIVRGRIDKKIIYGDFLENLDVIPPMPWKLFNMENYLIAHLRGEFLKNQYPYNRVGNIHTDRGCPNSCIYCYNSTEKYRKVRYHSPERVLYEIKYLIDNYNVDHVHFIDDNLMMNTKRLEDICLMIQENIPKITWDCAASTNAILANRSLLPLMRASGCRSIAIGLESQSERILKIIKGPAFSPEKNLESVRICKENGLSVQGNFLIGIPTETEEDLSQTVNYILKKEIDHLSMQIVKPYPGTRLWYLCKDMGIISDSFKWDSYFNRSFHEKFNYQYLSRLLIDCNNAYIPYTYKRLIKAALKRPKDALRKIFFERDGLKIIKKTLGM